MLTGSGFGAVMSGHKRKKPSVGRVLQRPEPPAQFWNPERIKFIPMRATVGPVTRGGKI
jgi:hypothetical protein